MKALRNLLIALIALMSFVAAPVLVTANSGQQVPDCKVDPAACQAMLDQYIQQFGPLPESSPTPVSVNPDIAMTGGENPPQDVVAQMQKFEGDLNAIALTYCTDPYWAEGQFSAIAYGGMSPQQAVEQNSTFTALGWQPVHDEYATYLQQQVEAGYNVPSRPPTLWELIQKYPGCENGKYEAPSK